MDISSCNIGECRVGNFWTLQHTTLNSDTNIYNSTTAKPGEILTVTFCMWPCHQPFYLPPFRQTHHFHLDILSNSLSPIIPNLHSLTLHQLPGFPIVLGGQFILLDWFLWHFSRFLLTVFVFMCLPINYLSNCLSELYFLSLKFYVVV